VAITVNGSYHNIGVFLDQVSKLNRIVTANNIKLSGGKRSGDEMTLTASLELVTYRFLTAAEGSQVKKNTKKKS
jgi:type IV pilus assembly protein PilO